jgi:hypothetical protein
MTEVDTNEATRILDMLQKHQTEAEFDAMIARNKLLAECKSKGFERMKKLGIIASNDKQKRNTGARYTSEQKKEMAHKAAEMIKKGMKMDAIRAALGNISYKSISDWMKKEGIKLDPKRSTKVNVAKAVKMISEKDMTINQVADRMKCTTCAIKRRLAEIGYKYSHKTHKLIKQ